MNPNSPICDRYSQDVEGDSIKISTTPPPDRYSSYPVVLLYFQIQIMPCLISTYCTFQRDSFPLALSRRKLLLFLRIFQLHCQSPAVLSAFGTKLRSSSPFISIRILCEKQNGAATARAFSGNMKRSIVGRKKSNLSQKTFGCLAYVMNRKRLFPTGTNDLRLSPVGAALLSRIKV